MSQTSPRPRRSQRTTAQRTTAQRTNSRRVSSQPPRARRTTTPGLRPVRDAGLDVRGSRRSRKRNTSPSYLLVIALSVLVIAGTLFAMGRSDSGDQAVLPVATAATETEGAAAEPAREPTPCFACLGELDLHLPIDPDDVTAVAFHQASGVAAQSMTSLVPDADMEAAVEIQGVPPLDQAQAADLGESDLWVGCVLRMWRSNRTGTPDTAADCGALPGSAVFSPVSGTVVEVKAYKLYDKYDDYEIHIRPDGFDDIDLVLIHVDDVLVSEGDIVTGGVTQLACVRKMSDKVDLQLGGYTANGGDHVHMQLNAVASDDSSTGADGS